MKWSYFAIHRKIKICMKTACEGRATALFMRFAGRGDTRKLCTAPWKTARVRGLLGLRSHLAIPWKLALSSSLVLPFRQDDIDLLFPGCIRSLSLSLSRSRDTYVRAYNGAFPFWISLKRTEQRLVFDRSHKLPRCDGRKKAVAKECNFIKAFEYAFSSLSLTWIFAERARERLGFSPRMLFADLAFTCGVRVYVRAYMDMGE